MYVYFYSIATSFDKTVQGYIRRIYFDLGKNKFKNIYILYKLKRI